MKILSLLLVLFSFTVSAQTAEPIGYYSNGSLKNGVRIPDEGPGYLKLFLPRNRGFGAQDMIDMITKSAASLHEKFSAFERLQVGDIAQEGGGKVSDLHGSHQNGLDVDLAYFRRDATEQDPNLTTGFKETMVVKKRLSKNFDTGRNWELVKKLHENGRVQRIFMDPVIKRELCRYAALLNETKAYSDVLRSLRPYPNHADHLHVRIRCPQEAVECQSQEEVPPGTGCATR